MESKEGSHDQPTKPQYQPKSGSELMSSANIVAGAAKSTFSKDPDHEFDKGKVAGAAGDLLGAASHYGKLEENQTYGKYVEKAENYLQQYQSSQPADTTATAGHPQGDQTKGTQPSGGDGEKSGYGDYMKMAQGLLNNSGGDKTESHPSGGDNDKSGGFGDYMNVAQGFLKK